MAAHKNHQNPTFKHLREVVLWLHDYKCYVSKEESEALEVHHIDKDSTNHVLFNLVPVKPSIHVYLGKTAKLKQLTPKDIKILLLKKLETFK